MDCGSNAVVQYSFQDESSVDSFKIGTNDGKMCLAQQLDHEAKDVHNVIVLATDKGDQSDTLFIFNFLLILNFFHWDIFRSQ
jgi:hypothetical protein